MPKDFILTGMTRNHNGRLSVQDGYGRMGLYWNTSLYQRYLANGDPSFKLDMNMVKSNYFNILYAPPGLANQPINWKTHLSITNIGNIGINNETPTEKLHVKGKILADDLLLTDGSELTSFMENKLIETLNNSKNMNNIDYFKSSTINIENNLNILDSKITSVENTNVNFKNNIDEINYDVLSLINNNNVFNNELYFQQNEIKSLNNSIINLQTNDTNRQNFLNNINNSISTIQMNITNTQSNISSLNSTTTLLQNENINIKLDNENIKNKIDIINNTVSNHSLTLTNVENMNVNLKENVINMKTSFENIKNILASIETSNSENKYNFDNLKESINNIETRINDSDITMESLNETINNLQTSDNLLKQAMIQLNNSITTIQNSNNILSNEFNKVSKNTISVNKIFEKAKYSCSCIYFTLNQKSYVGTGFFITLDDTDLTSGLFITAAHCVIEIDSKNNIYNVSDMLLLNPINNSWININSNNIFIDGIADIALIKTYIDFSYNKDMCLKLAQNNSNIGDLCYIIGNSSNIDSNGVSFGIIKDNNYSEPGGYQIVNSIYISTNGLFGYSGCPILDMSCNIIGIYTFGISSSENVGGGANLDTLNKSLNILKTYSHNKLKRYLGFDWNIPNPFILKKFSSNTNNYFINKGVLIYDVSDNSPFYGFLSSGDLLLGIKNRNTNENIDFGSNYDQYTPGILIYNYSSIVIDFYYIKKNTTNTIQQTIALNKSYFDVPNYLDGPLQGGLNLNNKNISKNIIQRKKYFNI